MTERKCFVFKFADVEVREREFLLIKAGERIAVEPKAFRVLLFLLQNPGRLITKDEIVSSVWNASAVSDNSLTRSIAQLRRVLGDDSREPLYILTVPTVGYRFLCDVSSAEDGFGISATRPHLVAKGTGTRPRHRLWVVTALCACVLIGISILTRGPHPLATRFLERHTHSAIASLAVLPLTNLSGDPNEEYFADGMTDELTTMLAKDSTLRIVSRTSAMQFKDAQ